MSGRPRVQNENDKSFEISVASFSPRARAKDSCCVGLPLVAWIELCRMPNNRKKNANYRRLGGQSCASNPQLGDCFVSFMPVSFPLFSFILRSFRFFAVRFCYVMFFSFRLCSCRCVCVILASSLDISVLFASLRLCLFCVFAFMLFAFRSFASFYSISVWSFLFSSFLLFPLCCSSLVQTLKLRCF